MFSGCMDVSDLSWSFSYQFTEPFENFLRGAVGERLRSFFRGVFQARRLQQLGCDVGVDVGVVLRLPGQSEPAFRLVVDNQTIGEAAGVFVHQDSLVHHRFVFGR